jgi:hypothetical protein
MFFKIKKTHDILIKDFIEHTVVDRYTTSINGIDYGIWYSKITMDDATIFENFIPKKYLDKFEALYMKINSRVTPHTDSGIKCSLNFYIDSQECETVFYRSVSNPSTYQIENQTNGVCFNYQDVVKLDSFIAKDKDIYLLDVSLPHSVETDKKNIMRQVVVLQTNFYTYHQVLGMLKETNSI